MKVEFKVTADTNTGDLAITCPEVFESKNTGWGSEVRTNYSDAYKQIVINILSSPIRARFLNLAKATEEELERAEAFEEDK